MTGRQTAQNLAASLYSPDTEEIKHEVEDPNQQARTHPLFESVTNQLEMAVQEIMRLRRRQILVKLPESDEMLRLSTPTLARATISRKHLQKIQKALAIRTTRPQVGKLDIGTGIRDSRVKLAGKDQAELSGRNWQDSLWRSSARERVSEHVLFRA